MDNTKETPADLPYWVRDAFAQYAKRLRTLDELLHLTMTAIARLRAAPALVEALVEAEKVLKLTDPEHRPEDDRTSDMARAEKEAAFANREVTDGFPLLHEQAVVSLWGWTEDFFRTLMARWIQNYPGSFAAGPLRKLRVQLGEYETLAQDERYLYVVEMLERDLAVPLRQGVNQFEVLLNAFDISGPVDDEVRRDLYELSQVRNVIVHRASIADRRFLEACPWKGVKLGDRLSITHQDFGRYFGAVVKYFQSVRERIQGRLASTEVTEATPRPTSSGVGIVPPNQRMQRTRE